MRLLILLAFVGCVGGFIQVRAAEFPPFAQHPAQHKLSECQTLDFNSYFRTQQFKKHIIKDNPDLGKPNFGGKYIILKQELMMETLWFIADCETGKFFHEQLSGVADFRSDSLLLVLSKPRSNEMPQYQLWNGEDWVRVDAPVQPSQEQANQKVANSEAEPTGPVNNERLYSELFGKYVVSTSDTCKDLDFNSYFRAQNAKNNIIKLNPDRSKPNFAGKYLLLRNDVLFETIWLIADCTTGKFLPEFLKDNLEFRPNSELVLIRHSSDFVRLALWRDQRFVDLINPTRAGKQEIENKIYDQEALDLLTAVGASKSDLRFRFEDLKCIDKNCTVRIFPSKDPRPLTPEQAVLAATILKKWGGELQVDKNTAYSIDSGVCTRQKKSPVCEIQLRR